MTTTEQFDPVSLEIMWSRMLNVAEEMWSTVLRTAVSTIIASANDFGCEVLDAEGRSIAHAYRSMPVFNMTMPNVTKKILKKVSGGDDAPGRRVYDERPVDVRRTPAGHRYRVAGVLPGAVCRVRGQHSEHLGHRRHARPQTGDGLIRRGHLLPTVQIVRQG